MATSHLMLWKLRCSCTAVALQSHCNRSAIALQSSCMLISRCNCVCRDELAVSLLRVPPLSGCSCAIMQLLRSYIAVVALVHSFCRAVALQCRAWRCRHRRVPYAPRGRVHDGRHLPRRLHLRRPRRGLLGPRPQGDPQGHPAVHVRAVSHILISFRTALFKQNTPFSSMLEIRLKSSLKKHLCAHSPYLNV